MKDTRTNQEKIKGIFYDYCVGMYHLEVTEDELNEIARRIEREVMGVEDDNEIGGVEGFD